MKNFDRRELLKIGLMYGFLNPSLNVAANEQSAFLLDQKYGTHEKQVFDIFFTEKKESPVVLFIHGGAWSVGNKKAGRKMAKFFNANGFNFVSMNYRFVPEVNAIQQAQDVASAINSLSIKASDFGIDKNKIGLIGHSAGAHLAALSVLDVRYLKQVNIGREVIKVVVLLDGAGYDIPQQIQSGINANLYKKIFGQDENYQKEVSPITHAGLRVDPAFQMHHVQRRKDSMQQAHSLAQKLRGAGTVAEVESALGESHMTIQKNFGDLGHVTTEKTLEFFKKNLL